MERPHHAGRVYLFTSLLVCAECKHNLVGYQTERGYYYYRCNQHFQRKLCTHRHSQSELRVERWLLDNLASEIEKCKIAYSVNAAAKERSSRQAEKAALKNKLTKLKELYVNDLIDLEDYRKKIMRYIFYCLGQHPGRTARKGAGFFPGGAYDAEWI